MHGTQQAWVHSCELSQIKTTGRQASYGANNTATQYFRLDTRYGFRGKGIGQHTARAGLIQPAGTQVKQAVFVDLAHGGAMGALDVVRSEERRGGKECVRTGSSRWSAEH